MSCPFYGRTLVVEERGRESVYLVAPANHLSNQCALITSALSPCWVETEESETPDWTECPRNPEVMAGMSMTDNAHRCFKQLKHLRDLQRARRMLP